MLTTQLSYNFLSKVRAYSRLHANLLAALIVLIFSTVYFFETCLRASAKYFWYDELFTVYICRLPTFHASWNAVLKGADFNPPLLYALTRLANGAVGEGLVGSRLPAMIGFWICSLCLFRIVRRQCGLLGGSVAMTLPLFTMAYFYAYEARPHGIVLGFCGLAWVFWQNIHEKPRESWWSIPFGLSLAGAGFAHCYGIAVVCPFALAEAVSTVRSPRLRWGVWTAIVSSLLASAVVVYPLLQSYNHIVQGTSFAQGDLARWRDFSGFYNKLVTPSLFWIVLLSVLLLSVCLTGRQRTYTSVEPLDWTNLVLPVSFLALPAFGILLGKIFDGPFVGRYFLSAVLGLSVLIGYAAARCRPRWLGVALVCTMVLILGRDFGALLVHRSRGWGEFLAEPGGGRVMNTDPGDPMANYSLLKSRDAFRPLPIVIPQGLDFVYLATYDRAQGSRLYDVNDVARDTFVRECELLRTLCGLRFNPGRTIDEFTKSTPEFFVYGKVWEVSSSLSDYEKRGGAINSIKFSGDEFLADVQMQPKR